MRCPAASVDRSSGLRHEPPPTRQPCPRRRARDHAVVRAHEAAGRRARVQRLPRTEANARRTGPPRSLCPRGAAANETSTPTHKRSHRLAQKTALLSQEWRRRESNPGSVTTPSSCVGSARCDAGSTAFGRLQTVDRDPVMYAGSGHRSFDMTEMVIQATASIRRILERGWLLSGESWGFTAFGQPTQPRAWGLGRRAAASTRARPHTRRLSV